MKKTIFKTIIFIIISIIISCANEKSEVQLDEAEAINDNGTNTITGNLSKENLQILDMRYLIADNGEYLYIISEENSKKAFINYTFYTNQSIDGFVFDTEINDGYIGAKAPHDNGTATMTGNLSDAGFNGKIDGKEINFVNANSPLSGAKVVRYTYTNVAPENTSEEDEKTFEYYSSIFLFNNEKNLEIIDKINLDINSEITSEKLDINKLSDIKNILSNDMMPFYNEWADENEYMYYYLSISEYGIDYLSEKIASINNYVFLYMGGAHGTYGNVRKVYSLSDGKRLKIEDILIDVNDSNLINKVKEKLLSIESRSEEDYFNLDEISLQENNFYINSKGLIFTWGIYEIAPYAMGYSEVLFSIDEITPYLKDEYKSIFE